MSPATTITIAKPTMAKKMMRVRFIPLCPFPALFLL
jgi:hypothetical protein